MADDRLRAPRGAAQGRTGKEWVWVRDDSTGHQYDVQVRALRPGMTEVEGVPHHFGARPRPTKHRVGKDGEAPSTAPGEPARMVPDAPTADVDVQADIAPAGTPTEPTKPNASKQNGPTDGTATIKKGAQ